MPLEEKQFEIFIEVARQEHVLLIDLNAISLPLFDAMRPKETLKAFVHDPANTFPFVSAKTPYER